MTIQQSRRLTHHKNSHCPICQAPIYFRSDELHWNESQWEEAFRKAGWKVLRGAYGRVLFVCSDLCVKVASAHG